ncbi:MAG: FAD-binding protein, partial [Desulfitobacterium sp.]|nr:FAD-binding protein [Desulfitobacterium sp.]
DPELLRAYVMNSGEAVEWLYNRGRLIGTTAEKPNDKGLYMFIDTSMDFTGEWTDGRFAKFDYGKAKAHMYAPWVGPKPNNAGTFLSYVLDEAAEEYSDRMKIYYNTPGVQLITENGKVKGVVGQLSDGTYVKFNANKAVILATGDYQNNPAMVNRWCPDVANFDKKQFQKTGDGHLMAITAGAVMEDIVHTKMLHDFDAGLMYEEPFLYVNMKGERFCNEFVGFVYMNDIMLHQDMYKGGKNYDDPEKGSLGWYCQIYDSNYMNNEAFDSLVPPAVMEKYMPEISDEEYEKKHGQPRTGVFTYLIDTWRADTLEELADKLGIEDKKAFLETIQRYNELCEKGVDEDFGKDKKWMNAIKKPPFYGIRRHLRVSALCSGVYTNGHGQALNEKKEPIEGLYCVGNLGGQFYGGVDYPFHATGLSLGRCYTFGRLAGKHAAAQPGGTKQLTESGTTVLEKQLDVGSSGNWKDGTYQGASPGIFGDDIKVTVTISDGKITAITVDEHKETENIGGAAFPTYIDAVIANQSTKIDAVSGATRTMEGFTNAVNDALSKAVK